ncbi:MAG: hypothetical protein ACI4WY_08260 [Anaerovoracaceae bacterium]
MKNDKEFLDRVYEKRDAALSRRKICRKRLLSGGTALAACMVLMVGGWQMDLFGVSSDSATMEMASPEDLNAVTDMAPESDQASLGSDQASHETDRVEPGTSAGAESDESSKLAGQVDSYYMLPAASLTDAAGNSNRCSGGEEVEKLERRAEALAEAGNAVRSDEPVEDWQEKYAYELQIEKEPQVFTYYYINEEGDLDETE